MHTLKHRSFAWMVMGQFVSTIGDNFYVLAIYWYVLTLTHSHWDILLVGLAQTLPAIGSLFWGVWIDQWNKRHVMITSDLLRFTVAASLAAVTLGMARPSMFLVFLLVFILRSLGTFFGPAANSLMPALVPEDQLTEASGLAHAVSGSASLIGVALGGVLIALVGPPILFALDSLTFLISVGSLLGVHTTERGLTSAERALSFVRSWKVGFQMLWQSLWIRRLLLAASLFNLVLVPLEMILPQWVHGPLHGNAATLGWLNAVFLIGYVCGALMVPWTKRWPASRVIGWSFAALGLFTVVFGQVVINPWPYLIVLVLGMTMGIVEATVTGMLMRVIPERYRGRTWSSFSGIINLITPLGMVAAEVIIAHWGMPILFLSIGGLVVVLSLTFVIPVAPPTLETMESFSTSDS